MLAQTPLNDWHLEHGARMVDFAGWSMPVQYTSIVEEHQATRTAATIFDISHMGRLRFDGPDAEAFLDRLLTRKVVGMGLGRIRYSLMTNASGGILDDVLVYHLETPSSRRYHMLVVNASNREKIVKWIQASLQPGEAVEFNDRTMETAMIAVQGPDATRIVEQLFAKDLSSMGYYTGIVTEQMGKPCIVTRTGYTGEDGYELIVRTDVAQQVWNNLMLAGREFGVRPAGFGARDTLRLEAGMPLYGHELTEEINPIQAGLCFAVNLKDRKFSGHQALVDFADQQNPFQRIGLELRGRRVPREDYAILRDGEEIGKVSSGTFSPTLGRPIAMAYVVSAAAEIGTEVKVDIRGKLETACVVELPFYSRPNAT